MTSSPRHPLPMAATGCACCAPTSVPEEAGTAVEAQSPSSDGTATTYQVEGMTCGHCAGRVTEALTALEGVLDVQIDLVAGEASAVTVTSTTPVAEESVRAAVARAGYAVTSSWACRDRIPHGPTRLPVSRPCLGPPPPDYPT